MIGRTRVVVLAVGFLLPGSVTAQPVRPVEPLVEQVRASIDRGVRFLRQQEAGRGSWEVNLATVGRPGGWTCLAMLALLNCGVKPDDPMIQRGLETLRKLPPQDTYVVGLQTMVFAEAGLAKDRELVQRNVDWLISARVFGRGDNQFRGWSYGRGNTNLADNSNSQYALLGLHAGKSAGAKIDPEVWKSIQEFYLRTQEEDGGWTYMPANQIGRGSTLTMTVAGFCGLQIAGMELTTGRQGLQADGMAVNCGQYQENKPLAEAMKYIGRRLTFQPRVYTFYNIYGVERAGRLSGQRFIGNHDWYREGCEFLVRIQQEDGSWAMTSSGADAWPVVSTSFALLFLSKGRTPILISKLAYGAPNFEGWNNKRHDARHLVEYASRELFKKQPLAWQIYDARVLDLAGPDDLLREAGDLLQSPIVYMNGHTAPRLTDQQKRVLKKYLEEGGFLFAESCCGRAEFTAGFRELMNGPDGLFPDNSLRSLPAEHPIWRAHFPVPPGEFAELEGIELGCKTVVVFSPQPLAGFYEENLWNPTAVKPPLTRGPMAFRLAGNVIAYATGLEPPKPRLTKVEVADDRQDRPVPRGYLKVGQVKHEGDWRPAPKAMRNLMAHLRSRENLEVALSTEEVRPSDLDLHKFPFLYMHGRNRFSFPPDELKAMRANLETGGLLFADACCGKKEFDEAFREMVRAMFPDKKLERIPLDDELLSKDVAGEEIKSVRVRRDLPGNGGGGEFTAGPPFLEGIKIDGRWAVIYSRYDVGCALEKQQSTDCLGHDHASALKIGAAVVMYALKR